MKKPFIVAGVSLISFFILSSFAYAQSASVMNVAQGIGTFAGLIDGFTQTVVKAVGTLFMAGAMVAFFYGIVQYVWGAREGNETKIKNGNTFIQWSLIALFVMFSVYGIVRFGQGFICGGGPCDNKIVIPEIYFGKSTSGGPTTGSPLIPNSGGPTNGSPLIPSSGGPTSGSAVTACDGIASESARSACYARNSGVNSSGGKPAGYSCNVSSDCASGNCVPGGVCGANPPSSSGSSGAGPGASCNVSSDCASGNCATGGICDGNPPSSSGSSGATGDPYNTEGSIPSGSPYGSSCNVSSDCASGNCAEGGICQ